MCHVEIICDKHPHTGLTGHSPISLLKFVKRAMKVCIYSAGAATTSNRHLSNFLYFAVYSANLAFGRTYKASLAPLGITYTPYIAIMGLERRAIGSSEASVTSCFSKPTP